MRHPAYVLFASGLLVLLGAAEYRGWSLTRAREARTVPRSVRDNPGAYRSPYVGPGRYLRGK